jgi:hypothetical protein
MWCCVAELVFFNISKESGSFEVLRDTNLVI